MLVGFRGKAWSGGCFESRAKTPERAAELVVKKHGKDFPLGVEGIDEVVVTDFPRFACTLVRGKSGKWVKSSMVVRDKAGKWVEKKFPLKISK